MPGKFLVTWMGVLAAWRLKCYLPDAEKKSRFAVSINVQINLPLLSEQQL